VLSPADSALVVLWVDDTGSSFLSSFVGPLARRFEQTLTVLACAKIERWEVRGALTAGAAGIVLNEDLDAVLVTGPLPAGCAGRSDARAARPLAPDQATRVRPARCLAR
jgi:hypothetical protein